MSPTFSGKQCNKICPPTQTNLNEAVSSFIYSCIGSIRRKNYLIFLLFAASMMITTAAYSIPDSPCDCTSFTTIGSPNTETNISSLLGGLASNTCYFIRGTLVINTSTVWYSVRLSMDEGALIRADEGLLVINSYIAGCDVLWQGIRVTSLNNIGMFSSKIQAANTGILMEGNTGIACQYNEFIDNYVGISIGSPLEEDQFDIHIEQKEPVLGCKFYTASESLPDPYPGHPYYPSWPSHSTIPYDKGYAGIFISGAGGLHIGKNGAEGFVRNKIYNMRNGIVLRHSVSNITGTDIYDLEGGLTGVDDPDVEDLNQFGIHSHRSMSEIYNNTIYDLLFGISANTSWHSIHNNTIEILKTPNRNFTRGIYAQNPQTLSIVDNDIVNGWRGIMLERVNNSFEILKNTLDRDITFVGNIGIFIASQRFIGNQTGLINQNILNITDGNGSVGIQLNNTHSFIVAGNIINYLIDEGQDFQNQGIGCSGSAHHIFLNNQVLAHPDYIDLANRGIALGLSGNNTVSCNTVENMQMDLYFLGHNVMTSVERNEMGDAEYGLYLFHPVFLGTQEHLNNQWIGDHSVFGAFIEAVNGGDPTPTALMSTFIVDSGDNSDFLPEDLGPTNPIDISDEWFILESGPEMPVCFNNPPPAPLLDADTLVKFLLTPMEFEKYDEELQWMLKADIYEMILSDPGLTVNATLDSFYNVEFYNPLGKLVTWQRALSTRYGIEETDKQLTEDTLFRLATDLMYIDSVLETSPVDSATWMSRRSLKTDTVNLKLDLWLELIAEEDTASIEVYEAIADSLYNLTTGNTIEAYFRSALMLKADHLLGNSLAGADSADILELATLCPFEGGRAVVVGQELHSLYFDSLAFIDPEYCIESQPFSVKPDFPDILTEEIPDIVAYPNPAKDLIRVDSPEKVNEVFAFDAMGRLIWKDAPLKLSFDIATNNWQSGSYYLRIYTNSGEQTLKINILK